MSLEGKTVLITGAALRVGRSMALAAAGAGANLVIHYHNSGVQAKALQNEIARMGREAKLLEADLEDPKQSMELINRAQGKEGLFALVNNAAVFESLSWETTDLKAWERHLMINLTSPFLLSQAFARAIGREAEGRIVNLLDWRVMRPGADHLPYTISKTGLAALTQSLAIALAPNITVNGLALGAILASKEGAPERLLEQVPAGRWGNLDEVGQALIFLLNGPGYITGEILHIDGGRHLV